jgi:hypothetical protein
MIDPIILDKFIIKEQNIQVLRVKFFDAEGKELIQEVKFGTDQTADMMTFHIKRRANSIVGAPSELDKIELGVVDTSKIPDDPRPIARIEAENWLRKANAVIKIKELVDSGQLSWDAPEVIAMKAEAAALYKPEHFNYL